MKRSELKKIIKEELLKEVSDETARTARATMEEENAYRMAQIIADNVDKYSVSPTSLGTAIAYVLEEAYNVDDSTSLINAIKKELANEKNF
jgi:hypothetical protein